MWDNAPRNEVQELQERVTIAAISETPFKYALIKAHILKCYPVADCIIPLFTLSVVVQPNPIELCLRTPTELKFSVLLHYLLFSEVRKSLHIICGVLT